MSDRAFGAVCEHGRLHRVCPECEAAGLRAEVEQLRAVLRAAQAYLAYQDGGHTWDVQRARIGDVLRLAIEEAGDE